MEAEKQAIEDAYNEVVANLQYSKAIWLQDMVENPEVYKGIDQEDVFTWFVESF